MATEAGMEMWQQLVLMALSAGLMALLGWIMMSSSDASDGDAGAEESAAPLPVFGANFTKAALTAAKTGGARAPAGKASLAAAAEEEEEEEEEEEAAEEAAPAPAVVEKPAPAAPSKASKAAPAKAAPAPAAPATPVKPPAPEPEPAAKASPGKKGKKGKGGAAPAPAPAPVSPPREVALTPEQKAAQNEVRKVQKKLREITEIKEKLACGDKVSKDAAAKVKQEPTLLAALAAAEGALKEAMEAPAKPPAPAAPAPAEVAAAEEELPVEEAEEEEDFQESSKAKKKKNRKAKKQQQQEEEEEEEEEEAPAPAPEVEAEVEEEEEAEEAEEEEEEEEAEEAAAAEEEEEVEEEEEEEEEEVEEAAAAEEEEDEEAAEEEEEEEDEDEEAEEAEEAEEDEAEEAAEAEAEEAAEDEEEDEEAEAEAAEEEEAEAAAEESQPAAEEEAAAEEGEAEAEAEAEAEGEEDEEEEDEDAEEGSKAEANKPFVLPKDFVRPSYPPTEREKEMLKLKKKIREIEDLEKKQADGVKLASNQEAKLEKKAGLLEELAQVDATVEPHTIEWSAVVHEYMNPLFGIELKVDGRTETLPMSAAHMNPPVAIENLGDIATRFRKGQEIKVRIMRGGTHCTNMSIDEEDFRHAECQALMDKIKELKAEDDKKIMGELWESGNLSEEEFAGIVTSVKDQCIFVRVLGAREVRCSSALLPAKYTVTDPISKVAKTKRDAVQEGMEVQVRLRWDYRNERVVGQLSE